MKQLTLDLTSAPQPTLDNFITGVNAELLQNLRRLAARTAREHCYYLWGRPGSGRSHLLKAAVAALNEAGARAVYIPCSEGMQLAAGLESLDCVALDDVDQLDRNGEVAVFDLYNALRERGGTLLASAAAPPAQLTLRGDLSTRLAWGLVYQVHALTDENKAQALAERAASRGFQLAPEVSDFLLTRARRDLPTLLATLDALDRYSLETRRPVTVPLARELLLAATRQDPGSRIQDSVAGAGD
ncbi:MAG TPA: DnaA regulatory inactivator Hda [Burkholderiales bacterium]|nr:DnaA regulatory inactivator Hda [Burkholderiales bacterium]